MLRHHRDLCRWDSEHDCEHYELRISEHFRMLDRLAGNVAVFAGDADKNREFAKSVVAVAFGLADSVIALAGPEAAGESARQCKCSENCVVCEEWTKLVDETIKALGWVSLGGQITQLPEMICAELGYAGSPGMRPSLPVLVREALRQKQASEAKIARLIDDSRFATEREKTWLRALGFEGGDEDRFSDGMELIERLKTADGEAAVWNQAAKKAELHAQAWQETAAQNQRNADYYRGIVHAIAEPFGERARTADDGTVADQPLAERVKELALKAIGLGLPRMTIKGRHCSALLPEELAQTHYSNHKRCAKQEGHEGPHKCQNTEWRDQIARPGAPRCDALVPSALNGGYSSSDRFCERPAGHEGPHRCQAQWGEQCASEIETVDGKIVRCRLVEGHGANHEHKTPDYGVWVWASHDAIKPNKAEPLDRNPDRVAAAIAEGLSETRSEPPRPCGLMVSQNGGRCVAPTGHCGYHENEEGMRWSGEPCVATLVRAGKTTAVCERMADHPGEHTAGEIAWWGEAKACGERMTLLGVRYLCKLDKGHYGWHRDRDGTTWPHGTEGAKLERARMIAAGAWMAPTTSHIVMEPLLAEQFARILVSEWEAADRSAGERIAFVKAQRTAPEASINGPIKQGDEALLSMLQEATAEREARREAARKDEAAAKTLVQTHESPLLPLCEEPHPEISGMHCKLAAGHAGLHKGQQHAWGDMT